ncbi:MAG: IS110 family transposase [Anaerolineales bacterium]|nr:IS110 family transposase [Anaerolineales bacterium]
MFYCGIDVAKHKHAVVVLDEQGKVHKPAFTTENTHAGMQTLLEALHPLGKEVCIGLEATGHYWLALYDILTRQGYTVVVLNPLQISAYRRSGVRKVKSDKTDAVWIADFLRIANLPASSRDIPSLLQLRELTRFRFWLAEQIGDCKRKLLTILDRVFPEYESMFSSVFVQSSKAMLHEAVTAQDFVDFDLQELTDLLAKTSRGRFGAEKAQQIQQQARQSIGIGFLANAVHVEMRCLLAQIDLLEDQQVEVDNTLETLMQTIPQHILTIPGIGLPTGAAILAEIGDVSRFESEEKLVAYAGIDATVHQSGQFNAGKMHMSKRGSPYLRLALWQAASMAIQHNDELKIYYQKKRKEDKAHGTALGAVCRKLLVRVYIILKEHRPYEVRKLAPSNP